MKAFLIFPNDLPSRNSMLVSVLSAFVIIESIGTAYSLPRAINIVRQRYPHALIFDSRVLEENKHEYLVSILEDNGSFILMPRNRRLTDRYIYVGIDFSVSDQKGWLLNEISETLRDYRLLAARQG